jgi:hypothetical protein
MLCDFARFSIDFGSFYPRITRIGGETRTGHRHIDQ